MDDSYCDPKTIDAMSTALIGACKALGQKPGPDQRTRLLAMKIIEHARKGERDPNKLQAAVLRAFQN